MTNLFEDALTRLSIIFSDKRFDVKKDDLKVLTFPKRTFLVSFPVKTSKGLEIFKGYRVQFNDTLGPTKGGMRYHPKVDLNEINALAFWMTLKNSLVGLPYGGGKGGIEIDPRQYTKEDLEKISREFIRQISSFIGPTKDIPAPDVYTNPQIMGWMVDEYNKIKNEHLSGVITGKPLSVGGSRARAYSTAQGGFYVFREAAKEYNISKSATVAIQGFGNAGMHMARIMYEAGYKIVAVSDSKGGVYNQKGLNILKLIEYKKEEKQITGFSGRNITNKELLELNVDVLVPAALENVITKHNAKQIKAKMIIELANGPISIEADEELFKRKIIVLPDILSNAGGVIVSYFEWVQNNQGFYWTETEVLEKLDSILTNTFKILLKEYVKKYGVSFRTAAYVHAVKRILQAEKDLGHL